MGGERARFSDVFAKQWDAEFSKVIDFKDYEPWSQRREAFDADGDDFGTILRDNDDAVPDCVIEEIEEFVRGGSCLSDLKSGKGAAGGRRCAWIDDRSLSSLTGSREYKDRVTTATGAYRRLKLGRFDADGLPDADRRLMHFRFLDPNVVLALAETAPQREISLLRQGIWKHLASKTSIHAKFTGGHSIFQMEMHIQSLELRTRPIKPERSSQSDTRYPTRQWIDLSFLNLSSNGPPGEVLHGIRRAHFSLFVSVSGHRRWVGCSFVDKHLNDDDEDLESDVSPSEGVHMDPISNGKLDADIPIWDSREYFLVIYKIQIGSALKEWVNLTRKIERAIERYFQDRFATSSKDSARRGCQAEDLEEASEWTQQTMELLSQLLKVLSDTIKAWHGFSSPNGDIGYFLCDQDVTSSWKKSRIAQAIFAINRTVQDMQNLKAELEAMRDSCCESRQALQLRLTLVANDSVRNNGNLSSFTLSIIAPIMLIIAYYSIPQGSVPFKLDPKYFMLATLTVMLVLRLLFGAVCAFPGTSRHWKKGAKWITSLRPEFRHFSRLWTRQAVTQDGNERRQEGLSVGNV